MKMTYEIHFTREGKITKCLPETMRQDGEIYVSVFDGHIEIVADADDPHEAIEIAKERYKKVKK